MDRTAVFQEIVSWPVEDRLELIDLVWDDLVDSGWQPTLTEDLRAELDRRLAAAEANPEDVLTWEDIINHVRRPR